MEREYLTHKEQLTPRYSAWNSFPTTEDPYALYKYASLEINLSKDFMQTNRQTYSLLDLLGDCGGLMDCLLFLGRLLTGPVALYTAQSRLSSLIVSVLPSQRRD